MQPRVISASITFARTSKIVARPSWRRRLALVTFTSALALSGVARAQSTLVDDRGVTISLAGPPARVVTLLPSLTESVCALGYCDRIVGTDRFSNWPARVAKLPKVGGIEDAQVERIVALKPDVVLLSTSGRATARLEKLGLKVVAVESRSHADVHRTLALIAQMFGGPPEAELLWTRLEREITAAAARVPPALRGQSVYFEIDATPYGAGPGSFIGETLSRLGLRNALPPELGPFPKLNPEYVVKLQPDIIMAAQPALAAMPKRPGWKSLRALGTQRTCAFANQRYELLIRPGPRLGEAANLLADCLVSIAKAR